MKNHKLKIKGNKGNKGMTYVELIVVLSIFSVITSVVIFNYGEFQAKVDMKNLASDIALKIVEAQKSSLSGVLPLSVYDANWKPSYGIHFNMATRDRFVYFVDLNLNGVMDDPERLDTIVITKDNLISAIDRCSGVSCDSSSPISPLSIIFKRPDSQAVFRDSGGATLPNNFDYIKITIQSPQGTTDFIKVYPSGRIQVN
ncbi:MAG: type II secretion system protein [Candidatus Paceibacterota bacterium]